MNEQEIEKLKKIYNHWLDHDPTPAEQVGWSGMDDQTARFDQFVHLIRATAKTPAVSILDVGCGDGALLPYLHDNLPNHSITYTGIDINPRYIARAKKQHAALRPAPHFITGDFETHHFDTRHDYVLCSGAYNVNVFADEERTYTVFFAALEKMISLATVAAAINFLCAREANGLILTGQMFIYDKNKITSWCTTKNLRFDTIEGYDPFDTTIAVHTSVASH